MKAESGRMGRKRERDKTEKMREGKDVVSLDLQGHHPVCLGLHVVRSDLLQSFVYVLPG